MTDNQHLEDRLRQVLTLDAERAPAPSLSPARFRASTLPGRAPARRRATAARWVGAAAAVAVGATIAVVGLDGPGAGKVFASWESRPGPISAADTARVDAACRARTPLIVDRRGHSAYAVYRDGPAWIDCLTTIPGLAPDDGLPDRWQTIHPTPAGAMDEPGPARPVVVLSVKVPEGNAVKRAPVTWVSGRLARNVARISIATSRGAVIPTVRAGVFAAWWPGNDSATAVLRGYDGSGRLLATVDELNCGGASPLARIRLPGQAPTGGCG